MSFFREQEIARRTSRMHAENHGRLAVNRARFTTAGWGSYEFEEIADFDATFIEEPTLSVGFQMEADEWREALEDAGYVASNIETEGTSLDIPFPVVSGFVTTWEQDDNGYYVGAYCAASVQFVPPFYDPETLTYTGLALPPVDLSGQGLPAITHHFRFEGVALKGGEDPGEDAKQG